MERLRKSLSVTALTVVAVFAAVVVPASSIGAQAGRGSLTGQVVRSDGEPAAGVKAIVYATTPNGRQGPWLGRTFTDATGAFSFAVDAGCYVVVLVAPDGDMWETSAGRFARHKPCVATGADSAGLGGTLHRSAAVASIAGTAWRDTGADPVPAAGIKIILYAVAPDGTRGAWLRRSFTAADGGFAFDVSPVCHVIEFVAPVGDTWTNTATRFSRRRVCPGPGTAVTGVDRTLTAAVAPAIDGRVTIGTAGSSTMNIGDVVPESSHGTRIYCPVSHFAHDDPVVFPGQSGASHLHMFWGNTGTDVFSTATSLLGAGRSSCEGGINNRSAYWVPALFNAQDEAVVAERTITYYKSFAVPDRSTIEPIPNGLKMLANRSVPGSGPWFFRVGSATVNGAPGVTLHVTFPSCLAVDGARQPVLSSADNVSHLSYPRSTDGRANGCPNSHPYRIPSVIYSLDFAVDPASDWYLASDMGSPKGATLHADYIAAWDDALMRDLTDCNIESRNCDVLGSRGQLPDRFLGPDGAAVYLDSTRLAPGADRTPFGTTLGPRSGPDPGRN